MDPRVCVEESEESEETAQKGHPPGPKRKTQVWGKVGLWRRILDERPQSPALSPPDVVTGECAAAGARTTCGQDRETEVEEGSELECEWE